MAAFDSNVDVEVHFGFGSGPFTATPSWTDVSAYVRGANWTRGRPSLQATYPAGNGSLLLDNTDGRFYPWNTSSPYTPNVKIGVPVRIRATHNSILYPLFYGYLEDMSAAFPTNTEELISIPIVERSARLARHTVTLTRPEELSHLRIGAILDAVGWPAAARDFDVGLFPAGLFPVAGITGIEEIALRLMRDVELAEQGYMFQTAAGDLRFLNRASASGLSPLATFGPSGADLTYVDVTVKYSDDLLFNDVTISGADGIPEKRVDATSRIANGPITYEAQSDAIPNSTDAGNTAVWILDKYKATDARIVGFEVDPAGSPAALWPEVLGRELRDLIRVKALYPGTAVTLDQEVTVEQVTHRFTAAEIWTATYACHPLPPVESQDYWILGTSQLGTETRLI